MGLICSCFGFDRDHHEPAPFQTVVNKYKSLFHRGQVEAAASSNEARTDPPSNDNVYSNSQQNGLNELVMAPNKAAAQTGDTAPIQQNIVVPEELNELAKEAEENKIFFSCSDDEDVCPTCLEEYDDENPKIVTNCNHHYHLGCIFEWMERSALCPVCGKLLLFEQMN